jgi:hypothetical protein
MKNLKPCSCKFGAGSLSGQTFASKAGDEQLVRSAGNKTATYHGAGPILTVGLRKVRWHS